MKKILILFFCMMFILPACADEETPCHAALRQTYQNKSTIYNVLVLSPQQARQAQLIEEQRMAELDLITGRLTEEQCALKNLQESGIGRPTMCVQRKNIKSVESHIKKINDKYDRQFCEILCPEQRCKYDVIKNLAANEEEICARNEKIYTKDPHLTVFGVPRYSADCEGDYCQKCAQCAKRGERKRWFMFSNP